ncbi:MAG: dihydrolipoyllysine-residue acetyltransferase [Granulosicoccus sp.]
MSDSNTSSSIDIIVPDIGDSENVEIIEILVAVGDQVSVDDSLLTLESDKASMEIPASSAGVIESLSVEIGETVNTGDVVGRMSTIESASASPNNDSATDAESESTAVATDQDNTESETSADKQPVPQSPPAAADSTASPAPASSGQSISPTAHINDDSMRKAHASPGVRRYAREHGADLSLVSGTGPKNRVMKTDVIAFIKQAMENASSNYGASSGSLAGGGAGIPPIPEVDFSKFGDIERVELGRINKISAANLHRAWLNLPMVTHHDVADVTEMEAFRKQLKNEAREGDAKVTGLAFHMKALVKTLKAFPKVNSSLSADGEALFYKHYYHIGIAVDTPNGLVVPVFRDVDKKSITELAAEMADMSTRARAKKLKPDEMQGASMTISSLGGIGGTAFTPIVNPPEVAILGITRATMQPVWNGSDFIPRLMCPLDLTYDHRVVDGADAARFMAHYVREVSDIRRLLL